MFDYRDFKTSKTDHKNKWTVYTNGKRIKYDRTKKRHYTVDPTKNIADALLSAGLKYAQDEDIREKIVQSNDSDLIKTVYHAFLDTLRMRNGDDNEDYIISPVKDCRGDFFRTDPNRTDIPKDADANGAYNIALKGELMLRMIAEKYDSEKKLEIPKMEHAAWFEFMQTRSNQ
jgi:CRISPR-associated protein Cpf1